MMLVISLTVGITFGAATWGLLRGRGGASGFGLCMVFGMIGAFIGAVAAQAIARTNSPPALAIGAVVGSLLATLIETFGFGSGPKKVGPVDPKGVAATPPSTGLKSAAKTGTSSQATTQPMAVKRG